MFALLHMLSRVSLPWLVGRSCAVNIQYTLWLVWGGREGSRDWFVFYYYFFTNTNLTFLPCSLYLRVHFWNVAPMQSCSTTPPQTLTYTPYLKVMVYLLISLAEAFAGPAEFSRLEQWEGPEEERPGRLSAAGRMVSLSDGCGGHYQLYIML